MGEAVRRTSSNQAYQDICRIISEQQAAGLNLLPPVRTLAKQCKCSLSTAVAAIRRLAAEGYVNPVRRVGTRIIAIPQTTATTRAPSPPPMTLFQHLLDDLLCGSFDTPAERLPPIKQLMARYGAGRVRIERSLRELRDSGWIRSDGKSFRRRSPGRSSGSLALHLLIVGDNQGVIGGFAPHRIAVVRSVEEQCRLKGLLFRPHIIARDFGRPKLAAKISRALAAATADPSCAGFIVNLMHMTPALIKDACGLLTGRDLRVALLNDSDDPAAAAPGTVPAHWRRFTMTVSDVCGYAVGRYLLQRGDRCAAFVLGTHPSQATWANARLAGLRRAFADAGAPEGVVLVAPELPAAEISQSPPILDKLSRLLDDESGTDYVPQAGTPAYRLFTNEFVDLLGSHRYRQSIRQAIEPALDRALAAATVTALVAANDFTASVALDLLHRRGVQVPGELAVVAFDNSELALEQRISSYDFNAAGMAALMVSSIVDPAGVRTSRGNQQDIELEGFVMERATSARSAEGSRRR
jgi:DNA-binding transcriptional regulator YhcF (GntR family)